MAETMSDLQRAFDDAFSAADRRTLVEARLGRRSDGVVTVSSGRAGYVYISMGANGDQGQNIARDLVGVDTDVSWQTVYVRKELNQWVIRRAQATTGGGGGGGGTLDSLSDVDTAGAADGDLLAYDSASGEWIPFTPTGTTGGAPSPHALYSSHHTNDQLADGQFLRALLIDGSRPLQGNLAVSPGITIDTVDISAHAGDLNIHHDKATAGNAGVTVSASQVISLNLEDTAPGLEIMSTGVRVKSGFGIMTDSTGTTIKLRSAADGNSGLHISAEGLTLRDDVAGNGLVYGSGNRILRVGAGTGILSNLDDVAVNQSYGFVWEAEHRFNADPQLYANLDFMGGDRSITASNKLTLQPAGDLLLNPDGTIYLPTPQLERSELFNDFVAGITGFSHFHVGGNVRQLSIGKIKADELHVRVFSADETRVSRGAEFWARSFGIVEETFDLPGTGNTVDVWFEEAPDLGSFALFIPDEWVQFRTIDQESGLIVQNVWFLVVDMGPNTYIQRQAATAAGVEPPHVSRQQFRLNRRSGGFTTMEVKKGATGVGYGQPFSVTDPIPGQGVVHLSAIQEDGGPFIQIQTFESVSAGVPQFQNRVRMGNLLNTVDYDEHIYGFAAGNDLSLIPNPSSGPAFSGLTADQQDGLRLFNTDIRIYDVGVLDLQIDPEQGLAFRQNQNSLSNERLIIAWYDDLATRTSVPRSAIGSYRSSSGGITERQIEIFVTDTVPIANTRQRINLRATSNYYESFATLSLDTRTELSSGALGAVAGLTADEVYLTGPVLIGGELDEIGTLSRLHVYENTVAVDATSGVTIQQAGTGDTRLRWMASNPVPPVIYTAGIDQSDSYKFKMALGDNLGFNSFIAVDPATVYVGMGTVVPSAKLTVVDSAQTVARFVSTSGASTSVQGRVQIALDPRTVANTYSAARISVVEATVADLRAHMFFQLRDQTSDVEPVTKLAIRQDGRIGFNTDTPVSFGHFYQNDTLNGSNSGVTIEQDGTGDAVLHFLRGAEYYSIGIDADDGDKFKISKHHTLGTTTFFTYDPAAGGTVTIPGLTGGSGGGGTTTVLPGDGIDTNIEAGGTRVSVDGSVVRSITAGAGLGGGGGTATGVVSLSVNLGTGLTFSGDNVAVDFADVVPSSRTITVGGGMNGGGALSSNISISLALGNGLVLTGTAPDQLVQIEKPAISGLGLNSTGLWIQRRGLSAVESGLSITAADGIYLADTVAGAGLEWESATDRYLQIALGAGLEFNGITRDALVRIKTPAESGLIRDATGLYIDTAIAGAGSVWSAGVIDVVAKSDGGLQANTGDIQIKLRVSGAVPTSGLWTDANGLWFRRRGDTGNASGLSMNETDGVFLADAVAGRGLEWTDVNNRFLELTLGAGLEFSGTTVTAAVRVDQGYAFAWTGDHTWSSPGVVRFNTTPQVNADLNFISTDRSITTGGTYKLTLAPGGDLLLDPIGLILLPTPQTARSELFTDTVANILGFSHFHVGGNVRQLSIGKLKADELHVRVFSADETRVSRGAEFWARSFGIVEETFNNPPLLGTRDVWFEEAPDLGTFALFIPGEWLQFRTVDADTGLIVQNIWYRVLDMGPNTYIQRQAATDGPPPHVSRQQFRLERRSGGFTTMEVRKGSVGVGYGLPFSVTDPIPGQGVVHLSALDHDDGPFIQIMTFESVADNVPQFQNRVRMGNLRNTVDYGAGNIYGFAAGNNLGRLPTATTDPFSGLTADEEDGLRLFNTDLILYNAGQRAVELTQLNGLSFQQDLVDAGTESLYIAWYQDLDTRTGLRSRIQTYGVGGESTFKIDSFATGSGQSANVTMAANQDTPAKAAVLNLDTDHTSLSSQSYAGLSAQVVNLTGDVNGIGSGHNIWEIVSRLHVYESTTATGITAGVAIEQRGSGDARLSFVLTSPATGSDITRVSMGLDNNDGDKFKMSFATDIGSLPFITVDTDGAVTIAGATTFTTGIISNTLSARTTAGLNLRDNNNNLGIFIGNGGGVAVGGSTVPAGVQMMVAGTGVLRAAQVRTAGISTETGQVGLGILDAGRTLVVGSDSYVQPFAAFTSQSPVTVFVRSETSTSSNFPYAGFVFSNKQTGLNNQIAQLMFMNEASSLSDKRLAQIVVNTDGSIDDGQMILRVYKGAAYTDAIVLTASGDVGFNNLTPGSELTGSGTFSYGSSVTVLDAAGTQTRMVLRGSVDASLDLIDTGATANLRLMQLYNDDGITRFRSVANSGAIQKDNILAMDHATGNVGVGTSTPAVPFHLYGTATTGTNLRVEGAAADGYGNMRVMNDAGSYFQFTAWGSAFGGSNLGTTRAGKGMLIWGGTTNDMVVGTDAAAPLGFSTNATRRMTISSAGRVGIGDTTFGAKLTIDDDQTERLQHLWLNGYITGTVPSTTGAPTIVTRAARGTSSAPTAVTNGDLLLNLVGVGRNSSSTYANASALIRFFATENFTSTNRGTKIQFLTTPAGASQATGVALEIADNGVLTATGTFGNALASGASRMLMQITSAGTIGTFNMYGFPSSSPREPLYVGSVGDVGGGTSSRRYKTDIEDVVGDVCEKLIAGLRGITYHEIGDRTQTTQYGFIAEEVAELPGAGPLVLVDPEGLPRNILYERFLVPLIVTIQRLTQRVEELERHVLTGQEGRLN